ncbi:DUF5304 domain-containing protein [Streptomyces griseoincarnatus]|uniref:DUF5304 domain-containing protein n=1 Tax=Streptomyces sp. SMS_SU21 TaxID=2069440 RepID=UPI000C883CB8|nr:DUF5304 domain-containing protein [Streptomyces sp. SMS_SU21]MCA2202984.1 DUF5304 domain-containing protein [Streptomyces sp. SMS_SU21]
MSEQLPPPDDTGNEAGDETFGKRADDARADRAEAPSEAPSEDHADAWATAASEVRADAPSEARADAPAEAPSEVHDDAWATAAAEDLEAERARRRARHGTPPGSAAEEFKKLVDAVADKLSDLQSPLLGAVAGPAAQQVVRQVVQQAKAAVEPVIERNPDVFDHLAAAGSELLAAYRSAVQDQERRWTARDTPPRAPEERRDPGDDPGTGPGEPIDLD